MITESLLGGHERLAGPRRVSVRLGSATPLACPMSNLVDQLCDGIGLWLSMLAIYFTVFHY